MGTTDEELQQLRDEVEARNAKLAGTRAEKEAAQQAQVNDFEAEALRGELDRLDREIAFEEHVQTLSPVSVGEVPADEIVGDPEQVMLDALAAQKAADEAAAADAAAKATPKTPPPPPPASGTDTTSPDGTVL
jgi:hypothetical protein